MDSAKRVISGTWGEVWIDGELVAECTACQAKYTYNKETVPMCGQMANDKKVVSVDGTGSITLNKVYSRMQEKCRQAKIRGIPPDFPCRLRVQTHGQRKARTGWSGFPVCMA